MIKKRFIQKWRLSSTYECKWSARKKKIKKHFQNLFHKNNLSTIVKCNLKIADYLGVTLNLSDGSYKRFHKPKSEITYFYQASNHPLNIIKQLPLPAESDLSKLSSDEIEFIQVVPVYQESIKRVKYNKKLSYNNSDKYNSNNDNNNKVNCKSNHIKNQNNCNNNNFKFNTTDNWKNNDKLFSSNFYFFAKW